MIYHLHLINTNLQILIYTGTCFHRLKSAHNEKVKSYSILRNILIVAEINCKIYLFLKTTDTREQMLLMETELTTQGVSMQINLVTDKLRNLRH
jgi:hypothetical protein